MAEKYEGIGHVVQVIGPVLDIQFEADICRRFTTRCASPAKAINVPEPLDIIAEVQQHLGEGRVRAVAMEPIEGMVRGMKAFDLGQGHRGSRGPCDAGPRDERAWQARGSAWPDRERIRTTRFTVPRRRWKSSPRRSKCLKRASRSST